jgi:hypothetical protein
VLITGTLLSDNTINMSGGAELDFAAASTLDAGSTVNGASDTGTIDILSGTFTDLGNIQVIQPDAELTIELNGGTLLSNGLDGDIGLNAGDPGVSNSGTLLVLGGTLADQEVHVNDGTAYIAAALLNNDLLSVDGGLLEIAQTTTVSPSQLTFVNGGTSTIKFDAPTNFNGDGSGQIIGFAANDTIDIGANIIGTLVYSGDLGGYADLALENPSGSTIFSTVITGGDESTFVGGTYTVGGTGGTAGSFQVTQGSGDTLITESGSAPPPPVNVAPNDFNGDGTSDFLVEDGSGDIVTWAVQSGTLESAPTYFGTATDGWSYLGTGDFYGGGTADVLVTNSSGALVDWQSEDGTLSGSPTYIGTATDGWNYVGTGDFTGNGTDDILVEDGSGDLAYWPITDGTLSGSPTYIGTATDGWSFLATADLHGDGTSDILVQNSSGAIDDWYIQNGALSGSPIYVGTATDGWSFLGTGDFTGNGTDDILVKDTTGDLAYWPIANGTLSGSPTYLGSLNSGWSYLGTGDYYGNNTTDIAVENSASGAVAVWPVTNGAIGTPSFVASGTDGWHAIAGT